MPRDWLAERTSTDRVDTSDPFFVLRDVLEPLEDEIGTGGSGTVTASANGVSFSQASGAPAITGGSGKYVVLTAGLGLAQLAMSTISPAVGGPLTVQVLVNDVVKEVLQLAATVTAPVIQTPGTVTNFNIGDTISVNAISVGLGPYAQGVVVQIRFGPAT